MISLCMIARDNESILDAALRTSKPWVDEMLVVDTGSTDRTPEIARAHGARVLHFPWCDDFSAARNESLRHATHDWLFWMDSDDTLPPECGRRMRERLAAGVPDGILGFVMQVHCPSSSGEAHDTTVVDHVKLIRNHPEIRFEGRIHEQVLPSIRRLGGEIGWTDQYVVHSGADQSPEGRRRKLDRDLRLLSLDLEDRPRHPFVLFNLGMTLTTAGRHAEAASALLESIAVAGPRESHLRKAYALLVGALQEDGELDAAQRRGWEGLGRFPDDPELLFRCGVIASSLGSWEEAVRAFERVLAIDDAPYFGSMDRGVLGAKTMMNLAMAHEELGQLETAERMWRAALLREPQCRQAFEGLVSHLAQPGRSEVLRSEAELRRGHPVLGGIARAGLAIAAVRTGDLAAADARFEAALSEYPDDLWVKREYCRFLFEQAREAEAEDVVRAILVLAPDDASAHHNLGQVLLCQKRPAEAIVSLQTSLSLRPGSVATLRHLGTAQQAAGDLAGAQATWDRVARIRSEAPEERPWPN